MRKFIVFLCFLTLSFSLFAQSSSKKKSKKNTPAPTVTTAPAETKPAVKPASPKKEEPALLIKKGSRLVVLVQSIENLEKGEENWLPGAVRDRLEDNLSTYTEYIFVDAKNLSSVKKLQKESEGVAFDENDAIEIGKLTVAKHAVFITLRKTDAGYVVVSDITDLTTGEKIATAVSENHETSDGLFSVPGCAADDLTVKLCQKLGIKLTKERKYMLMHGDNILSAEDELKITKTEEKLYKSSIERLEKEIERLSKSTDLKATANKAKLEADKAMAEEKLKAAQDKKKRLAEEAKKAREDAEEDEARSEEQKQKRDQMAKEAAEKAAEVRQKILDSESIFTKITVIENKKKALLDIQQSVDDRRNEIFEDAKAEFPKKVKAIRSQKYRAAEKDEDGNPSATALARREKLVQDLQKETKDNVDVQWDEVRALTIDSMTELFSDIKADQEALETKKTVTSLEDDLKIQIKTYNGKTNAWQVTFWLYSNGLPVTNQSIDLPYKDLTGKEIDISNDGAYDDFMDTVDLYNSLFSRGDPVLTFTVSYTVRSETDHSSAYIITLNDVSVKDTITDTELCTLKFPEPEIIYQMNPVYNLTGDMVLRIPRKPEWDRKEEEYLRKIFLEKEKTALQMVEIPGKNISMATTETTQKLYTEIMGTNPSYWKGDFLPVERVSWVDAVTFCNKLSEKMGLVPVYEIDGNETTWNENANGYRLPTISEFEYASRGGQNFKHAGSDNIDEVAWHGSNSGQTREVGTKKQNAYGLYDMTGNVWEWCWNKNNSNRHIRGAGYDTGYYNRLLIGYSSDVNFKYQGLELGFRVCRSNKAFVKEELPANDNTEYFWSRYESFLNLKNVKMKKIPGKKYVMAQTEVTQELYDIIMEANPSAVKGGKLPVESVSSLNVVEFCNKLSEINGYEKAYKIENGEIIWNYGANGYRLPTKEEWEFAFAGNENYKFSGSDKADVVAWYAGNSHETIHEVATKKANNFGLYDMSGNVSEFIWTGKGKISIACGGSYESPDADYNLESHPLYCESLVTDVSKETGFRLCRGAVNAKDVSERNGVYAWQYFISEDEYDVSYYFTYPLMDNEKMNYEIWDRIINPQIEKRYRNDRITKTVNVEKIIISEEYICLFTTIKNSEESDTKYYTLIMDKLGETLGRYEVTNLYSSKIEEICEPVYKKFEKEYKKAHDNADAGGYRVLDYYLIEDGILTQWIVLGNYLPKDFRKIVQCKIDIASKELISYE